MRGRRFTAVVAAGVLAAVAGGCGGDGELAPQVPGPPAGMPLPPDGDAAPAGEDAGDDAADPDAEEPATDAGTTGDGTDAEPAPDESGTAAPETPETAAAPQDTGGGAAAPDGDADGPANDTAPPAGSEAEQFEDFCAQNPGAC